MIMPNVDLDTVCPLDSLYRRHPDRLRTAYGLHPTEVDADWRKTLWKIVPMLDSEGCVAVGEVGMDLYWDTTFRREQEDAFAEQLNIASEKRLPVIIHCRNALDEALQVISGLKTGCRGFCSTVSPEAQPMRKRFFRLCLTRFSASTGS